MSAQPTRRRVPAAERREALIEAAVHEFAHGGLHGTPVALIARRVGVAQPYVFSLFADKRELFLAAVDRGFDRVAATFERAAREHHEGRSREHRASSAAFPPPASPQGEAGAEDALHAMGRAYRELLVSDRDCLMLQLQSYAACDDPVVRARVRERYAELVALAGALSGGASFPQGEPERLDDFLRHGMALNVAAALGVEDLSAGCEWVRQASSRSES